MFIIEYEYGVSTTGWGYSENQLIKGKFTATESNLMSDAIQLFSEKHPLEACTKLNVKYVSDAK